MAESSVVRVAVSLEELVELVALPDPLVHFCLDAANGEVTVAEFDDSGNLLPSHLLIPTITQEQIYGWMTSFIGLTTDEKVIDLLKTSLKHPMAFRRFFEVLSVNPDERKQWDNHFRSQRRRLIMDWLLAHGFDPPA